MMFMGRKKKRDGYMDKRKGIVAGCDSTGSIARRYLD